MWEQIGIQVFELAPLHLNPYFIQRGLVNYLGVLGNFSHIHLSQQ